MELKIEDVFNENEFLDVTSISKGDPCRKDSISLTWKMKWVLLGGNPWSGSTTYEWKP